MQRALFTDMSCSRCPLPFTSRTINKKDRRFYLLPGSTVPPAPPGRQEDSVRTDGLAGGSSPCSWDSSRRLWWWVRYRRLLGFEQTLSELHWQPKRNSQIMSDDFRPNKWPVLPATQTTQRRQGGLSLPSSHVPLSLFMLHRDQAWGLRSISLVVLKGEKG